MGCSNGSSDLGNLQHIQPGFLHEVLHWCLMEYSQHDRHQRNSSNTVFQTHFADAPRRRTLIVTAYDRTGKQSISRLPDRPTAKPHHLLVYLYSQFDVRADCRNLRYKAWESARHALYSDAQPCSCILSFKQIYTHKIMSKARTTVSPMEQ